MSPSPRDVAQIRLANALRLFDEFVQATVRDPDAAILRGLEGRFAERLQIQPSYWSQIKSRSRQIGERLARQFEQLTGKPAGWMDEPHGTGAAKVGPSPAAAARPDRASDSEAGPPANLPKDADERFVVGLVLTYYRRHPQRAKARLLDLLGEVLTRSSGDAEAEPKPVGKRAATEDDGSALWSKTRSAVAPLKRKR
jgi:hypothetical protein